MTRAELEKKRQEYISERKILNDKKLEIIATGQRYDISTGDDKRSLTNVSVAEINNQILALDRKIADIEYKLEHGGRSRYSVRLGMRW